MGHFAFYTSDRKTGSTYTNVIRAKCITILVKTRLCHEAGERGLDVGKVACLILQKALNNCDKAIAGTR